MNESFNPTVASSNDSLNVNQVPVTQNPVYANQANTVVNNNVVPVQNTIPINNNVSVGANNMVMPNNVATNVGDVPATNVEASIPVSLGAPVPVPENETTNKSKRLKESSMKYMSLMFYILFCTNLLTTILNFKYFIILIALKSFKSIIWTILKFIIISVGIVGAKKGAKFAGFLGLYMSVSSLYKYFTNNSNIISIVIMIAMLGSSINYLYWCFKKNNN